MIRLSIRRPVAVAMVYACVALLGVAAWRNIPIEQLPDTSFPQLSLSLRWPGASPETMEAFVTSPVEATVSQMKGIENLRSETQEENASINVEFTRDTDMDFVRMDLSERIATLEDDLPEGVRPIEISQYVPREFVAQDNSTLLNYTFTGPHLVEALRFHLDENVIPELLRIRGIGEVRASGGRERVLEIVLDKQKVAALGITESSVRQAINSLYMVADVGAFREGDQELVVTIRNRPEDLSDIREVILPLRGGLTTDMPVRLIDVAEIRDTFEEPSSLYRINRGPAVNLTILRERDTNAVELAETIKARMAELEVLNPPGTQFILESDQSQEIRRQLNDLASRAMIAAGVIFVVLLGFLGSVRTAAVVFSTIAFSILIALNMVYFGGLTLNLMTMMGLALGFGLIVDNSIVVLENIYRKWQEGADPVTAAEKGSKDVVLPILAATGTTLIVFIPFLYLQGELRVYYLPLAIVVGLTLIASLFVAFTYIPALTARVLGMGKRRGRGALIAAPGTARSEGRKQPVYIRFYSGLLGYTLRFPWTTVVVAVACFGATWYLFDRNVTRGRVFGGIGGQQRTTISISITMPRGSDLARVDELTRFFEDRLAAMPEVERFTTQVREGTLSSGSRSTTIVYFPEELEFTAVPLVIEERLAAFSFTFTGAEVRVRGQGNAFYGSSGASLPNYRITLRGYNFEELADIADDLGQRLSQNTRVEDVDANASSSYRARADEFVVTIDREAVQRYGITVGEAISMVSTATRGSVGSRGSVTIGGDPLNYDVKLEGYRSADIDDLVSTVMTTSNDIPVPMGELIAVSQRRVIPNIIRENQQYQRVLAYQFRGPRPLGDTIRNYAIRAMELPPGYSIESTTSGFITREEAQQINMVLLISIGLVFMVTAGLFESIRQPLVVLMAVPMALIGVFLMFFFVRATFTREAYIGVIMMGGIVVNNAILLVDHINRVRAESGLPVFDAIIKATLERVRPILMTTATTVLGLLPLVLFMPSSDARIWNALTYALIGGLTSSTLFVLTTTPSLYLLFERIGRREGTREWEEVRWKGSALSGGGPEPAPVAGD